MSGKQAKAERAAEAEPPATVPPLPTLEQAQAELNAWVQREQQAHDLRMQWQGVVNLLAQQQAAEPPKET